MRFRRELREFLASFIVADKKSAKSFDFIVFTENDNSMFKD